MSLDRVYLKYNKYKKPLEDLLQKSEDSKSLRRTIKDRLIKDGILDYVCAIPNCPTRGMSTWLGKEIPLDLDHIDGDRTNNNLENLRLLCKICHGQTDTFAGKLRRETANYCITCGRKLAHSVTVNCEECLIKSRGFYKLTLVPLSILEKMVEHVPISEISLHYGIHIYQVKKWLGKNSIEAKPKGYWRKKQNESSRRSMIEFLEEEKLV